MDGLARQFSFFQPPNTEQLVECLIPNYTWHYMMRFPYYMDTRLEEGQIDRSPDHMSEEGQEVWDMHRPQLS
jgi:hypothetical protein